MLKNPHAGCPAGRVERWEASAGQAVGAAGRVGRLCACLVHLFAVVGCAVDMARRLLTGIGGTIVSP